MRIAGFDGSDLNESRDNIGAIGLALNQAFRDHIAPLVAAQYDGADAARLDDAFRSWLNDLVLKGELTSYVLNNVRRE